MKRMSKRSVSIVLTILIVVGLLSLAMFSCTVKMAQGEDSYVDMTNAVLKQLEEPENDDPAMVVHTSMGDITAVLYPEEAPEYVEQFTRLVENGYYNNTYIYEVQSGVYFNAGSPNEDGSLGDAEIEANESIAMEKSVNLWPFKGAFCVPPTRKDTEFLKILFGNDKTYGGTRFCICNTIEFDDEIRQQMEDMKSKLNDVAEEFLEQGGIPNYSQQRTIFAQAYGEESFKVIDAITDIQLKGADSKSPKESILIESIELGTWENFKK